MSLKHSLGLILFLLLFGVGLYLSELNIVLIIIILLSIAVITVFATKMYKQKKEEYDEYALNNEQKAKIYNKLFKYILALGLTVKITIDTLSMPVDSVFYLYLALILFLGYFIIKGFIKLYKEIKDLENK